jgi:hypothetical protein
MREIIMTISRRTATPSTPVADADWRRHFVETEPHWLACVPEEVRARQRQVETTAEIAAQRTHKTLVGEIEARDRTIAELNRYIGELQRERDARLNERLKRYWGRLRGGASR